MTTAERSAVAERPAVRTLTVTAYVEWSEETRLYAGIIPGIPGAYTQGATFGELRDNLRDVLETIVEEGEVEPDELACFAGIQQLEIAVDERPDPRTLTVTAYVEWGEECQLYVAIVPGIRGAHTQGATLDELRENLRDVLELVVEMGEVDPDALACFVGIQQLEIVA